MIGSVGGPGGRFFGRLPESSRRMTMATATTTGMIFRIKAMAPMEVVLSPGAIDNTTGMENNGQYKIRGQKKKKKEEEDMSRIS